MGLDRLGILFIVIVLPIALILNAYTNTQVDTLKMQLEYDSKLNACTADAVRTYQTNSLNEDASNLGDVRIGNINAAINVFFTSLSSNLNMSGYSRQFLQEYVPALVFTMYDGYYIYSKYTNTIGDEDYATQEEVDNYNTKMNLHPGEPGYLLPSYYFGVHEEGGKEVSQQLYGLKPFVHYSCRYKNNIAGDAYDFVVSYTLDNYVTIQGIVKGEPVDKSGYLIDITKTNYNSTSGKLTYRGVEIEKEPILSENLILNTEDGTQAQTKSYKYHKVNGVKYYLDEGDTRDQNDDYWFAMLNGIKEKSTYKFDKDYDDSAYNHYKKAIEFSKWVNDNLSGITDNDAQVEYYVYDENGAETTNPGLQKTGINIFRINGIEEQDSNFNQHRREVIRYTIEKNLSIAIANYNTYESTRGFDFRMPKFSELEWDLIQQNMTVISYLQGLPIGTKIYNGVSVIPNNVNEEVVSEQSIYIGDGGNTTEPGDTGNYYYSILTKPDEFEHEDELVGIYNVDLKRKEVEYNKQKYYYYPKLYFERNTDLVNIDAEKTDVTKNQYVYNGNIYKYIDKLVGASPDDSTKGYKIAKAFYTALGRERESRYNQRNNYEKLLTKMTDEEQELAWFNSQFTKYKGMRTVSEIKQLIQEAKNNNAKYANEDEDMRVNVKRGGYPNSTAYYENGTLGSPNLNAAGRNMLNNTPNYKSGSFVVTDAQGDPENPESYNGGRALNIGESDTTKYDVQCYYYNGRVKGIYVAVPPEKTKPQ